jgi:hypothetical protein
MNTPEPKRRREFTFCLWMLLVATAAFAAVGVWQRAERLRSAVVSHKLTALGLCLRNTSNISHLPSASGPAAEHKRAPYRQALAQYHVAMAQKCSRAIWWPWVEIEPDPIKPRP